MITVHIIYYVEMKYIIVHGLISVNPNQRVIWDNSAVYSMPKKTYHYLLSALILMDLKIETCGPQFSYYDLHVMMFIKILLFNQIQNFISVKRIKINYFKRLVLEKLNFKIES